MPRWSLPRTVPLRSLRRPSVGRLACARTGSGSYPRSRRESKPRARASASHASLLGSHIVDPNMRLDVVDLEIHIAPGAVVAHDSTCTSRRAPAPDGRPLIAAAMIVKDEQKSLPAALASLKGFVDEIIVCDT